VRDYQVELTKKLHVIIVNDDLSVFLHVHPRLVQNGHLSSINTFPQKGSTTSSQEGKMLAGKSLRNEPHETDSIRRHRVMYERRLRELARTADAEEDSPESLVAVPSQTQRNSEEHKAFAT
jgi:hypothetical protein